jgi:hypothetical protein
MILVPKIKKANDFCFFGIWKKSVKFRYKFDAFSAKIGAKIANFSDFA